MIEEVDLDNTLRTKRKKRVTDTEARAVAKADTTKRNVRIVEN
jgi:hypothetical protein